MRSAISQREWMSMPWLRSIIQTSAALALAALSLAGPAAAADQDHDRQGGRRQRPSYSELHRRRRGHLQGGRPRSALHPVERQGAGDGRPLRQSRFRADPVGRRAGRAKRRRDPLHRRPVDVVANGCSSRAAISPRSRTSRARPSATAGSARPTTTRARPIWRVSTICRSARTTR